MATYQTTYTATPAKGVAGQVKNSEESNRISRTIETAAIGFGVPVQRGTGNHGVVAYSTGAFLGITILDPAVPGNVATASTPDIFPVGFTAPILTRGQMLVTAGATVAPGDDVYYTTATGKYVTASGSGIVGPLTGVFFDTGGGDGDLVEISISNRVA